MLSDWLDVVQHHVPRAVRPVGNLMATGYGEPVTVGDLVHTRSGKWVVEAPTFCPNGHLLGPNRCLVGHMACAGHDGGVTWTCRIT